MKDYLHLYLGCECILTKSDNGFDTPKEGTRLMLNPQLLMQCLRTDIKRFLEVKPILRPLSDMTEKEWGEIEQKTSVMPDAWGYHGVRDMFLNPEDSKNRFAWMIVNEALIELRKKGIDVDGLIKSGVAIDKTKL